MDDKGGPAVSFAKFFPNAKLILISTLDSTLVITAQYFVCCFCLLPLILPWGSMRLKWKGLLCISLWLGSQIHWIVSYLREFKGRNAFIQLWVAGFSFKKLSKKYSQGHC